MEEKLTKVPDGSLYNWICPTNVRKSHAGATLNILNLKSRNVWSIIGSGSVSITDVRVTTIMVRYILNYWETLKGSDSLQYINS